MKQVLLLLISSVFIINGSTTRVKDQKRYKEMIGTWKIYQIIDQDYEANSGWTELRIQEKSKLFGLEFRFDIDSIELISKYPFPKPIKWNYGDTHVDPVEYWDDKMFRVHLFLKKCKIESIETEETRFLYAFDNLCCNESSDRYFLKPEDKIRIYNINFKKDNICTITWTWKFYYIYKTDTFFIRRFFFKRVK